MKKYIFIGISILAILVIACSKEIDTFKKVNPGQTATYPLNGEYWVQLDAATITGTDTTWTVDPYGIGYAKIMISNVASNRKDSIWVDDLGNIWNFKVRSWCDPAAKAFSVTRGEDVYLGDTTSISNGKLVLNGGVTKSGNKTDSIYMLIRWQSDATTTYRISGVRRTGFQADDY